MKKINDEDFITKRILKLIQHDISYYAMHTNFDSAPGCMADLAAGLLAKEIDADVMMILTSVDNVTLNYGTPDEQPIRRMDIAQAKDYIEQGQFEFASMLPKISASIDFLEKGKGRKAIITSLDKAKASLEGQAGTTIE